MLAAREIADIAPDHRFILMRMVILVLSYCQVRIIQPLIRRAHNLAMKRNVNKNQSRYTQSSVPPRVFCVHQQTGYSQHRLGEKTAACENIGRINRVEYVHKGMVYSAFGHTDGQEDNNHTEVGCVMRPPLVVSSVWINKLNVLRAVLELIGPDRNGHEHINWALSPKYVFPVPFLVWRSNIGDEHLPSLSSSDGPTTVRLEIAYRSGLLWSEDINAREFTLATLIRLCTNMPIDCVKKNLSG